MAESLEIRVGQTVLWYYLEIILHSSFDKQNGMPLKLLYQMKQLVSQTNYSNDMNKAELVFK